MMKEKEETDREETEIEKIDIMVTEENHNENIDSKGFEKKENRIEENEKEEPIEKEEDVIESTLIIINVIALTLFLITAATGYFKVGSFCFLIYSMISGGLVEPLILVVGNRKTKDKSNIRFHRAVLVVSMVYVIISLYTVCKVFFTYPIIEDKMYWLYYLMFVLFIPYIVMLKYNHLLGKKNIICKDEKSKIKRTFLMSGNLTYLISGIILFFVMNYRSHSIIDLSKIKVPEEITILHVNHEATINNKSKENNKLNSQDIEILIREISKYKVENLRYLDEFNFFINFQNTKEYHVLYLYYKNKDDGSFLSYKNKKIKIQYIEVYNNELIIYVVPVNRRIFDKMNEKYRLKLPREVIESLVKSE